MLRADYFSYMPELKTERLLLRKLNMRDASDIFRYSRDPEVARHVLWDAHRSIGDSRAYLRYMIRRYHSHEPASWGIEYRATGEIIGTIGFMWIQQDNSAAEVGYSLARNHWNQGLMTEALAAVIQYGFDGMHLNRIEAQHETSNPASGAVMRKCHMQKEGTLRDRLYNKGKYVDVDLYAILKKDFDRLGLRKW